MSKPMKIDFMIAVPNADSGQAIADLAKKIGYETDLYLDEETGELTCYCTKTMIPAYEAVIGTQDELDELARPHNGYIDGWGTYGSATSDS